MLKKYYATRSISVNGRTYNAGDIVEHQFDIEGLRRIYEQDEQPREKRKRCQTNPLFCQRDTKPEVSIIVTFHNQKEFIYECLDGFKRQDFEYPYELIAVVDASEQEEADYIKKNYPEVIILERQHKNANASRNAGLEIARGRYVAFFDGDDYPYSDYLRKLHQALLENGTASFSYARFNHEIFGKKKGKLPRCNIFEWNDSWAKFSPITNTPIMIYRDVAPKWDERFEIMQDTAYCLDLKNKGLSGVHVREELWYYRNHDGGVWNQRNIAERKAKAREILTNEYGFETTQAKVTFVSLISRDVVLEEYFAQIKTLGIPKQSHWFILVDSNDENLINKIKSYQKKNEKQFLSSRMFVTGENNLAYSRDFESRGLRIGNFIKIIINQAAENIGGSELLFMVEDDTRAPKNAFKKLLPAIKKSSKIVYASGIECGRGYTQHTGICWLKKDEKGEILWRTIPTMEELKGTIEIGGGGWYCWIGKSRELQYWTTKMPMRCFDGKMLGPDVMMVHDLVEFGHKCVCDTTVHCDHYDERRKVWLPAMTGRGYDIEFYKIDKDNWKMALKSKDEKGKIIEWTKPKI